MNVFIDVLFNMKICFGLSAGLVDTYINGVIVKTFIGDGFIGLLSGINTLTAVLSAGPYAWICNRYPRWGKWTVMVGGGVCFLFAAVPLLVMSDESIAQWPFIIFYFIIHGQIVSYASLLNLIKLY